jgi:hypothetical protein
MTTKTTAKSTAVSSSHRDLTAEIGFLTRALKAPTAPPSTWPPGINGHRASRRLRPATISKPPWTESYGRRGHTVATP